MERQKGSAETHEVLNQPSALEGYNAFTSDRVLQHYINIFGAEWGRQALNEYGHRVGHDLQQAGFEANQYKPEFHSHDRFGRRIDLVKYHPAYHQLMQAAIEAGHHSLPWTENRAGAHVVRAGIAYLHTQADPGSGCPLTMTFAAVPVIRQQADLAAEWLPWITARTYDASNTPFYDKSGVTIGMAMTEKQGGSDVRANTTYAYALGSPGSGKSYEVVGHKWFCSAPMCDAFLVTANTERGLSCFLLPRWRPDGSKNAMFIQRLKNKMGNISNASSEVEYRAAYAWLLGEEGRGIATILKMVALTRYDCMIGSAAIMRQATAQAIHHTSERQAFGRSLHDQPLMQNVLADLALESEAALAISMRLARSLDVQDEYEKSLFRVGTALGKYWICKRAVQHSYEAMESIGGVAVVEDNVLARLYREAPINAIWEGSGNIQCLDVARIMQNNPALLECFITELEKAGAQIKRYDSELASLKDKFKQGLQAESMLRDTVEQMALLWQASTLIQYSVPAVAESFVAGRLNAQHRYMYGSLPEVVNLSELIERGRAEILPENL